MDRSEQLLRAVGLRVTAPRVVVLDVLREGGHPTVDGVLQAARSRLGSVSPQAVYDVLRALESVGLAAHVEPAGSPVRYEARVGDNHHHVVCRECGALADVDCAAGAAPCLDPSTREGFTIERAEVLYWGLCPRCQSGPVSRDQPGESVA